MPDKHGGHFTFTNKEVELIRALMAQGSKSGKISDEDLQIFVKQCERTQLDPFSKQIYAIFRWDKRLGREKMSIQVSIDGQRLVAERTGKYEGQVGPLYCDRTHPSWTDVWLHDTAPSAAKVGVWKTGAKEATFAVAKLSSYCQKWEGKPTGMWATMPELMLAKCAEALALRKAFPQELSGLYTDEEMQQADDPKEEAPAPEPLKRPQSTKKADPTPEQTEVPKASGAPPIAQKAQPQATPSAPENVNPDTGEVYDDRGEEPQEEPLDELVVTSVEFKDGKKKDGTDYRVYFIKCSDGRTYTSFKDEDGQNAQLAKDEKRGILITAEAPRKNAAGKEYWPIVEMK